RTGRLRDPHPRRDAGRPVALHEGGRGGGGVVDRDADPRGLAGPAGARVPQLRGRNVGSRGRRGAHPARRPELAAAMSLSSAPAAPGQPMLRWHSRAKSIDGVAAELGRIWKAISLTSGGPDGDERRVAARSSVMNLVVIAGRGEVGERVAAIVEGLSGRHPSRTLIVTPADPDGPAWLDAQIQAHCVLPSDAAPETCSELVYLTLGGESGQHLSGTVAPLLIHDLPVTVWWPGEPHFESGSAREILPMADRVMVDGSGWAGDGMAGVAAMA